MIRLHFPTGKFKVSVVSVLLLCFAPAPFSQQQTSTDSASRQNIPAKSKRKLGKVSKPADFTGAGLFQLEYGYDGDFHAHDAVSDQSGTVSGLFNAAEDLQFQLDFDTFHALSGNSGQAETGIGDTYVSTQITLFSESQHHPSLGFAYLVKLPTASEGKRLGTGRVDHKLGVQASKKMKTADVDFNASLLINGKTETDGWETGYQLALGVSREFSHTLSLQSEIFGETLDTDQPRGLFVQGGFTYQPSSLASFDVSARAGLNSNAPRFGFLAGVSFSLANLYEGRLAK